MTAQSVLAVVEVYTVRLARLLRARCLRGLVFRDIHVTLHFSDWKTFRNWTILIIKSSKITRIFLYSLGCPKCIV